MNIVYLALIAIIVWVIGYRVLNIKGIVDTAALMVFPILIILSGLSNFNYITPYHRVLLNCIVLILAVILLIYKYIK